jgi:hypothetical protein
MEKIKRNLIVVTVVSIAVCGCSTSRQVTAGHGGRSTTDASGDHVSNSGGFGGSAASSGAAGMAGAGGISGPGGVSGIAGSSGRSGSGGSAGGQGVAGSGQAGGLGIGGSIGAGGQPGTGGMVLDAGIDASSTDANGDAGGTTCRTRADCPVAKPWCDPESLTCVECLGYWHCGGPETQRQTQFYCAGSCQSWFGFTGDYCDPGLQAPRVKCCVRSKTDPSVDALITLAGQEYCGNCRTHADCPTGQGCFEGTCTNLKTCAIVSDCGGPPWTCEAGSCKQCSGDAACAGGLRCDLAISRCRECLADADCPTSANVCVGGVCWKPWQW